MCLSTFSSLNITIANSKNWKSYLFSKWFPRPHWGHSPQEEEWGIFDLPGSLFLLGMPPLLLGLLEQQCPQITDAQCKYFRVAREIQLEVLPKKIQRIKSSLDNIIPVKPYSFDDRYRHPGPGERTLNRKSGDINRYLSSTTFWLYDLGEITYLGLSLSICSVKN